MKKEIAKAYQPQEVEDRIYKLWEESGYFDPDRLPGERPKKFVISMPPPNATGVLHIGHGCRFTYQDLMVRFHRLLGERALWVPGTDHASIATQTKVEKLIAQEGLTKYDLGREAFLLRVEEYVENSRNTIRNQVRKMGSSCDWSRERYTLDEGLSEVVRQVFAGMYEDGLIYRGNRIVNWCPRCESTIADDEVEYEEGKATLYFFRYSHDFPITIATTRPETKLGDTAVAVNPKDERYKRFIGKSYQIDLGNGEHEVRIIADRGVDMEFGTGALGVTPAHSMTDWQMAEENGLPSIKVIGEDGRMTEAAGKGYAGLTTLEARAKMVEYLRAQGLIEKEEEIGQNLSVCYRCQTPIEPLPSLQWFVDVNRRITREGNKYFQDKSLKEVMLQVVESGEIRIIPDRFNKVYFNWVENLRDWCVSRQLWFGHRIPVWYCEECGEVIVSAKQASHCPKCSSDKLRQDADTLDTWFSSGMWTFSTLMDKDFSKYRSFDEWVENSPDLLKYHPTSVMETAYDLIFFWVARMILMSTYVLGEIPFETVYFGGLVRDKEGRKMSKSLGNGIDPLEMIGKYGTDALRLSYVIGATPGNDLKVYEEKIENYRNFVNKLWNIARYILMSVEDVRRVEKRPEAKTLADEWILGETDGLVRGVKHNLEDFHFSAAGEDIYDFAWSKFADWYLEVAKVEGGKDEILLYVLERLLIVLHPFAPFVTEELWQNFGTGTLLMVEKWPSAEAGGEEARGADTDFAFVQDVITALRNIRSEYKIEPKQKLRAVIAAADRKDILESQMEVIKRLARLEELDIVSRIEKGEEVAVAVLKGAEVGVSLGDLVDKDKEKANLSKEKANLESFIKTLQGKLANEAFTAKAPEAVVAAEREKLSGSLDKLKKIEEKLAALS